MRTELFYNLILLHNQIKIKVESKQSLIALEPLFLYKHFYWTYCFISTFLFRTSVSFHLGARPICSQFIAPFKDWMLPIFFPFSFFSLFVLDENRTFTVARLQKIEFVDNQNTYCQNSANISSILRAWLAKNMLKPWA